MLLVGFVATSVAAALGLLGLALWKWSSHRKLVRALRAEQEPVVLLSRRRREDDEDTTQRLPSERPSSPSEELTVVGVAPPHASVRPVLPSERPHTISAPPSLAPDVVRVSASLAPRGKSDANLSPVAVEWGGARESGESSGPAARVAPDPRAVDESGPSLRPGASAAAGKLDKRSRTTPVFEQSGQPRPSRAPQAKLNVNVQEVVVRSRRDDR